MASKKKTFKPDKFASKEGNHESFGTVYHSMVTDDKFKKLSNMAKEVYFYCRIQLTSKESRECLFNHGKEQDITYGDGCFVFPSKHQQGYGFMDRGNFSGWMQELINAGFIERVEHNKHRRKVNVYRFSTRWKDV